MVSFPISIFHLCQRIRRYNSMLVGESRYQRKPGSGWTVKQNFPFTLTTGKEKNSLKMEEANKAGPGFDSG